MVSNSHFTLTQPRGGTQIPVLLSKTQATNTLFTTELERVGFHIKSTWIPHCTTQQDDYAYNNTKTTKIQTKKDETRPHAPSVERSRDRENAIEHEMMIFHDDKYANLQAIIYLEYLSYPIAACSWDKKIPFCSYKVVLVAHCVAHTYYKGIIYHLSKHLTIAVSQAQFWSQWCFFIQS